MAALTLADLSTRVLQNLMVLAAGETPSNEDTTLVEAIITDEHAKMQADGRAPWDLTSIPEHLNRPLVTYMAFYVAPEFGKEVGADRFTSAEREINRLSALKEGCDDVTKVSDF